MNSCNLVMIHVKMHVLKLYQQLNNCLDAKLRSLKWYGMFVILNVQVVLQPHPQMFTDAC